MSYRLKVACLAALSAFAAPAAGHAHPAGVSGLQQIEPGTPVIRTHCYDDCWHSRWRSHHRWGSHCCGDWHHRWRSHHRWGSLGGWDHSRYDSHYRWGSYHGYWRRYRHHDWDD